jgi:hypothetical protein
MSQQQPPDASTRPVGTAASCSACPTLGQLCCHSCCHTLTQPLEPSPPYRQPQLLKVLRFSGVAVPSGYDVAFQRALWAFRHCRCAAASYRALCCPAFSR